jgi:cell division septation protein DedD
MAQRSLPLVPSRIFTRKPSLAARLMSASLIALSLLVTMAKLGSAIHIERLPDTVVAVAATPASPAPPAAHATLPDAVVATPTSTHYNVAAATAAPQADAQMTVTAPPASPPSVAPLPEPTVAGSSAPLPAGAPFQAQLTSLEAPPMAAPVAAEAGRYWVEYGVFVGETYARRLQQALTAHGLAANLVQTHAPNGRPLVRVRSVALADYAEAREVAERVRQALGIGPLVHRSAPAAESLPRLAPALPVTVTASSDADPRYWVQFGAFPHADQAARLSDALRGSGVDTAVSTIRAMSGRLLFLVRSAPLADHASALARARRGQAANVDVLVGRSPESRRSALPAPARFAATDSSLQR